jgi:hypothetical protein
MSRIVIELPSLPGHKQAEKVVFIKISCNHNAEIG